MEKAKKLQNIGHCPQTGTDGVYGGPCFTTGKHVSAEAVI